MFILSLYLMIGVIMCAFQKEPEQTGDKAAGAYHMYVLLFVFIFWPVMALWWIGRRFKL